MGCPLNKSDQVTNLSNQGMENLFYINLSNSAMALCLRPCSLNVMTKFFGVIM